MLWIKASSAISVQGLRDAIIVGKVIEDYPDDKDGPSCLILGFTTGGRPIRVQCSYPSRPYNQDYYALRT